ncbi:MAG: hypothetical protein HY755_05810 [Nitrospirae bacterium]|nr:hypothetical protein [Nitrospirota bacterium]
MKNIFSWQVLLGLLLIALSSILYLIHYALFRDAHHIFLYLVGDIAFIPIEVLLVTLVIHRLLNEREKQAMLKKMNMVIGAFFSEIGNTLLKSLSVFDTQPDNIRKELILSNQWTDKDFMNISRRIKGYNCSLDSRRGALEDLGI